MERIRSFQKDIMLLLFFCAAPYQITHGPVPVRGPVVGECCCRVPDKGQEVPVRAMNPERPGSVTLHHMAKYSYGKSRELDFSFKWPFIENIINIFTNLLALVSCGPSSVRL